MDLKETLEDFCLNIRNEHGSERPSSVITNRASFIMKNLLSLGITYSLDSFPYIGKIRFSENENFYNIIVKFTAADSSIEEGIVFTAHHDIRNIHSHNCQDNSASVINLLKLCSILREKNDLKQNVYVVFTDCEEFGGKGALKLSEKILNGDLGNIKYIVNSELTALGEHIWCEAVNPTSKLRSLLQEKLGDKFHERNVPFNDSIVFRHFGIDSVCLGILPKHQDGRYQIHHWNICHSIHDTVDVANYDHMNNYVQFLCELV